LREVPVDVPWDELGLLAAMVARRRAELDATGATAREQIGAGRV
jgi:hypothetical protein